MELRPPDILMEPTQHRPVSLCRQDARLFGAKGPDKRRRDDRWDRQFLPEHPSQLHGHLSPAALDAAIRLLDGAETRGGIVEAPGKLG